jgi:hypothetical protein
MPVKRRSKPSATIDGEAVRWTWMNDRGWESFMGPVEGNQKPEAVARDRGWHCTAAAFSREGVWDGSPR